MNKKSYKSYIKELSEKETVLDENGKVLINVNINNEDAILSTFSSEQPIITEEFATFIDHKLTLSNIRKGIHLNINCDTIDENEQIIYEKAIKNYYDEKLLSLLLKCKKKNFISLILFVLGSLVLTLMIVLELFNKNLIAIEIYDIIAWVLIWEACDIFILQRPFDNFEKHKCYQIINSEITYNKK